MSDAAVVHATAPPNDLPPDRLRVRADARSGVRVDPDLAGWRYLSFRTVTLAADGSDPVEIGERGTRDRGRAPLRRRRPGRPCRRRLVGARRAALGVRGTALGVLPAGRADRAARRRRAAATAHPATVAIATAPARPDVSASLGPVLIRPEDIRVEIRGAGHSTRQINHIIDPGFPADRLLLVEVLTPAGNWSSWPPHKHDVDDMPTEAVLEEVYHYRFRRPEAWAIQRVYRPAGGPLGAARDAVFAVRDGEAVIVTDGYHPFAATDADDAYYLNALAGDRRTMACSFDPDLDAVRERWASETPDPRVPLVSPAG